MKKRSVIVALILVFVTGAANVCAESYFAANVGVGWIDDIRLSDGIDMVDFSFDPGIGVTAALGHSYYNSYRAELEFDYYNSDIDAVSLVGAKSASLGGGTVMALMLNGYYDFMAGHLVSPFLGGGVGYANAELDLLGVEEDDDVFAYQVIAGVAFKLSERLKTDLQYRYFGTEDLEFGDGVDVDAVNSHNLMIGLRFGF